MTYLIGLNHNIQHNGNGCADLSVRNKFSIFLKERIKEYAISLVAEEFNEDCLKNSKGTVSTAHKVVEELKSEGLIIEHEFCDPNEKEREAIGIPRREEIKSMLNIHGLVIENSAEDNRIKEEQRKYHHVREKSWFNITEKHLNKNLIFICGADHIKSFEALLTTKGHETVVLVENWKDEKI